MAGLFGIRAEDMEQVDALQKLRMDYPDGFPLVRPHVLAPIIVRSEGQDTAITARFGFSRRFSSFNARSDRLQSGKLWGSMFGQQHAIVPVSYVVEWTGHGQNKKPLLIQRADGKAILAPAVLGKYQGPGKHKAFAICTRAPNNFFRRFHDRMVGQCTKEMARTWLEPEGRPAQELLECVAAPADDELVAVPTSPDITKRKAGDWSPLPVSGRPITWQDVQAE